MYALCAFIYCFSVYNTWREEPAPSHCCPSPNVTASSSYPPPPPLTDWYFFFAVWMGTFYTRFVPQPNYLVRMAFLTVSRCLLCALSYLVSIYVAAATCAFVCFVYCLPRANICVWVQRAVQGLFGPLTKKKRCFSSTIASVSNFVTACACRKWRDVWYGAQVKRKRNGMVLHNGRVCWWWQSNA